MPHSFSYAVALFALFYLYFAFSVGTAAAAPAPGGHLRVDNAARAVAAGSADAPRFVVYSDRFVSGVLPPVEQVKGFNVFVLSFLLTEGAADQAQAWAQLSAAERAANKTAYADAGIAVLVSLFGATDAPTTRGADPVATARAMAAWVLQYGLDGVDVDYEDFDAVNAGDGGAEAWITSFTRELRSVLPVGQYILTHAPVAPWFSPGKFGGGAYLTVDKNVGGLIDWYNVQFYNQGSSEYTTCDGLLTASSSTWPQSALFQIAASGIALGKLVVTKPAAAGDASNGYVDPGTLAACLQQAGRGGYAAGVAAWEFPDADAGWIGSVRSLAYPE